MTERKLDIFDVLRATDRCNGNWLSQQSDEARKDFHPPVVMRWSVGIADGPEAAYMLWLTNERVNKHLYALYNHPDLAFRLIASCGLGTIKKHQWLAGTKKSPTNAAVNVVRDRFPEASDGEIALLMSLFTRESFKLYLADCGMQAKDEKDVVAGYDRLFPDQAPKAKGKKA